MIAAALVQPKLPWLALSPAIFAASSFGFLVLRYLVLGVLPYLYLYRGSANSAENGKPPMMSSLTCINRKVPSDRQVSDELMHSLKSLLIFVLGSLYVYFGVKNGWIQVYASISEKGWAHYLLTLVGLVAIHDTWFYWTHRLFHSRPVFRWAHRRHHQSVHTTPLSAFSFDAFEALTHAAIAPVAYSWFAVHPSTFVIFQLVMALQNLSAHSGFEWVSERMRRSVLLSVWVSSTVHHSHHQRADRNFGLYTTIWDRLMGTYRAESSVSVRAARRTPVAAPALVWMGSSRVNVEPAP